MLPRGYRTAFSSDKSVLPIKAREHAMRPLIIELKPTAHRQPGQEVKGCHRMIYRTGPRSDPACDKTVNMPTISFRTIHILLLDQPSSGIGVQPRSLAQLAQATHAWLRLVKRVVSDQLSVLRWTELGGALLLGVEGLDVRQRWPAAERS